MAGNAIVKQMFVSSEEFNALVPNEYGDHVYLMAMHFANDINWNNPVLEDFEKRYEDTLTLISALQPGDIFHGADIYCRGDESEFLKKLVPEIIISLLRNQWKTPNDSEIYRKFGIHVDVRKLLKIQGDIIGPMIRKTENFLFGIDDEIKEPKMYVQQYGPYGTLLVTAYSKEEAISLMTDEQHKYFDPESKISEFEIDSGFVLCNHGIDIASNVWLTSKHHRDTSLDEYIKKQRDLKNNF